MTARGVLILALTVVGGTAAFVLGTAARRAAPAATTEITLEPGSLDLGTHPWGETIPFSLSLNNRSQVPVRISSLTMSCACTASDTDYRGRVVASGSESPLGFTLRMAREPGPKTEHVTVMLDSGLTLMAKIEAETRGTYAVTPSEIDFGDIAFPGPTPSPRSLTFASDYGVRMTGAPSVNCDWLDCKVAQRHGATEVLLCLIADRLPVGVSTGTISLPTSDPVRPNWAVHVSARGIQQLAIEPPHVFLLGTEPHRVELPESSLDGLSVLSDSPGIRAVVRDGAIEVSNLSGRPLERTAVLRLTDGRGRQGRVLVSTF